jgi:hypothetical protein
METNVLFWDIISKIFAGGAIINSIAFWIQTKKISDKKTSAGVSVLMLSLFTIFQGSGTLYSWHKGDLWITLGFSILLLSCLNTIRIARKYR